MDKKITLKLTPTISFESIIENPERQISLVFEPIILIANESFNFAGYDQDYQAASIPDTLETLIERKSERVEIGNPETDYVLFFENALSGGQTP
jgi:hypothetical protein